MAKKISQLSAASVLNTTDEFEINQGGTSKKVSAATMGVLFGFGVYTSSNGITLTGSNFTLDNSYFTGQATVAAGVVTLTNSAVIGKVLTGYTSGAGTVAATDTILQAIQKLNGNQGLYMPLAGGTFTGNVNGVTPTEITYLSGTTSNLQTQINNIISGLSWKVAVRVATTANITLSGTQTIDGIAVIAGDRVLVKNQSTGANNGIYVCAAGAWSRSTDATTGGAGSTGILGATVVVEEGTVSADFIYTCSTDAPITINVTTLTFVKTSATTYTGSNGITLTGNNFTLDNSYFSGAFTLSAGVATIGAGYVTNAMLAGSISYTKLSTMTSAQFAGLITDPTGSAGSVVLSTSPTFTTQIITPVIYGSSSSGGTLTIDSTSNATKGAITFGTASGSNIYNFNAGSAGAIMSIQGYVTSTSTPALYFNQSSPSATNYALIGASTYTGVNTPAAGIIYLTDGNSEFLTLKGLNNAASSIPVQFFIPAYTARTASTNIPNLKVTGATVQWATGTLATQYFNYFTKNTLAFVGVSIATLAATNVVDIVTGGTNATITTSAGFYNIATALSNVTRGYGALFNAPTGAGTNIALGVFTAADKNLWIYNSSGLTIEAINDAASANVAMRFQALSYRFSGGLMTLVTTPLLLSAGTATAATAPLKFVSGTNLTTGEAGAMEYNGTNLFFTRTGTTREGVLIGNGGATAPTANIGVAIVNYYGSSATNFLGTPDGWFGIVKNDGSTVKVAYYN